MSGNFKVVRGLRHKDFLINYGLVTHIEEGERGVVTVHFVGGSEVDIFSSLDDALEVGSGAEVTR